MRSITIKKKGTASPLKKNLSLIHEETYESDIENKKTEVNKVQLLKKGPIDFSGLIASKLNKKKLSLKTLPELYDEELDKLKKNHLLFNYEEKKENFIIQSNTDIKFMKDTVTKMAPSQNKSKLELLINSEETQFMSP